MGRKQWLRFTLPDEESWNELRRDLKLSPSQAAALNRTLLEVDQRCKQLAAELERSDAKREDNKRELKSFDRALANAERRLQGSGVRQALNGIEMRGALSFVVSCDAGTEIHGEPGLTQTEHDRLLDALTPNVMRYLLQSMRRPVSAALKTPAKSGNTAKIDRELLLCLLARDAQKIIGVPPGSKAKGPFHNLCTWVFGYCNISAKGLEVAIARCLEKHRAWLGWILSASAGHIVGRLCEAEIAAIPDDPEAELKC